MPNVLREAERVSYYSPVGWLDYALSQLGLPRIDPLLVAISPQNVISGALGFPTPNDLASSFLERTVEKLRRGAPNLPRPPRLPGL